MIRQASSTVTFTFALISILALADGMTKWEVLVDGSSVHKNYIHKALSAVPNVPKVQVESYVFPPVVQAPRSSKTFFLGGAGVRGMDVGGTFVKFTAIAVYLEVTAVASLAGKWKGKSAQELTNSVEFFRDIVTGPFEKFTQVRTILPLTGPQYSERVVENCIAFWRATGTLNQAALVAAKKFLNIFKNQNFPAGASIFFTQSPLGSLVISFSKGGSIPKQGSALIQNKQLAEAVLESIIGQQGVSPAAKQSLAARISDLLKRS